MLHKLLNTIEKYDMIDSGDRVLIGVSGGADSVALLHMLNRLKSELEIELSVAHINHGLRGRAADSDAAYVENLCRQWDIPFFLKEVDIRELSKSWRISEEEAGRRVRFGFFDEVLSKIGGDKIALGHHRDDQIETILHNIIRGTGMEGLRGIKPIRDGKIIRPLLEIDRLSIEKYLEDQKISYRHDETNYQAIYTRNKIRLELIPYMEKAFNPKLKDSIVRMADILGEEDDFLTEYTHDLIKKNVNKEVNKVIIPIDFFKSCHVAIRRRIVRVCIEYLSRDMADIGQSHIDGILDICNLGPGSAIDLPSGLIGYRDYDTIVLIKRSAYRSERFDVALDVPGAVVIDEIGIEIRARFVEEKRFGDPNCVYIDGDVISGPLRIRNRVDGDRFRPLGMRGSKKLKDFFIDEKVPRYLRDSIPLVLDEQNIVWVVGYQIGDDYKITGDTQTIIELSSVKGQ